jgi:hypothetical protein
MHVPPWQFNVSKVRACQSTVSGYKYTVAVSFGRALSPIAFFPMAYGADAYGTQNSNCWAQGA